MAEAPPPEGSPQPPLPGGGDAAAPPPLPADPAEAAAGEAGAAQPPLPQAPSAPDAGAVDGGEAPPLPAEGSASAPGEPPLPSDEEEDPLVVAQRELEAAERARDAPIEIPPYDEEALKVRAGGRAARGAGLGRCRERSASVELLHSHPPPPAPCQEFYTDLKDAEREGEVNRILSAFKLNPYEQLNLRNGASVEEVRRQYRKVRGPSAPRHSRHPSSSSWVLSRVPASHLPHPFLSGVQVSLMVHPDKCRHARAKDAFEVIGAAAKDLQDEEKRAKLQFLLDHAKGGASVCWGRAVRVCVCDLAGPCAQPPPCFPLHFPQQRCRPGCTCRTCRHGCARGASLPAGLPSWERLSGTGLV